MAWFDLIIPLLFIALFVYGLAKQFQQSMLLHKTVSPSSAFNKRLLIGNHLYTLSFAGFVILLILNAFVYTGILPQTQLLGNTVSLTGFLFLVLMFIFKFGVIPKDQQHALPAASKKWHGNG